MQRTRAAKRYAKALLDYAIEKQQPDVVFEEMTTLLKVLDENIEFQRLLLSPIVKSSVKRNVMLQIFPNKSDLVHQLVEVLVRNKRLSLTRAIAKTYITQYHEYKQRRIAYVTTAQPISDTLKEQILLKVKKLTSNPNVELRNRVDESIVGGFILRVGDYQYNASISNKFSAIKRNFEENLYTN